MSKNHKNRLSNIITVLLLPLVLITLLYSCIYLVWNQYNNYLLKHKGQITVATIICKENGRAEYDIEYGGVYYRRWITLSKQAFRKITVGEQFYALFLPEKLKYDHENGITPRYFKIILKPLPYDEQTYLKETERIESMYGH